MFGQHIMPPTGVFVKTVEPPTVVSESVAPPARPPDFGVFYFHFVVLLVLLRAFTSCIERKPVCSSSRTNIFILTFPSIANSESPVGSSFICLDCGRTLEDAERHWQTWGNTGRTWCCPFRVGTYVTACWAEFTNASLNSQSCKMGEIVKPDAECVHLLSS